MDPRNSAKRKFAGSEIQSPRPINSQPARSQSPPRLRPLAREPSPRYTPHAWPPLSQIRTLPIAAANPGPSDKTRSPLDFHPAFSLGNCPAAVELPHHAQPAP